MLEHGGRLLQAVRHYGIPRERWLDLSTGVNPIAWQGEQPWVSSWNRLPEDEDGLIDAAAAYYGASNSDISDAAAAESPGVLPVSGSQAAIQALPRLRGRSRVGVSALGYNEHAHRWKQAGHEVVPLPIEDFATTLDRLDVLVVSNPNNPTGDRFTPSQLLEWHTRLNARGGWLVIDEAFADSTPESSVVRFAARDGLIVLRSLGKFFGLAGARVGFVFSSHDVLTQLSEWLGPWTIAGPSRQIAKAALSDREWQEATRQRLRQDSHRLAELLTRYHLDPTGGSDLFQWVRTAEAPEIHAALARRGILTRRFEAVPSLRFGLPALAEDWQRLEEALSALQEALSALEGATSAASECAERGTRSKLAT